MRVRFQLAFVPVLCLALLTLAVSPYNPNRGGSYREAWPDIAAIWIILALFLIAFWVLRIKVPDLVIESRVPGFAVLVWSVTAIVLGTVGLELASGMTGFPSEYQHLMLWFTLTTGIFQLGLTVLFREAITTGPWGKLGYGLSVALGIVGVCVGIGLSVMLLLIPSTGVT